MHSNPYTLHNFLLDINQYTNKKLKALLQNTCNEIQLHFRKITKQSWIAFNSTKTIKIESFSNELVAWYWHLLGLTYSIGNWSFKRYSKFENATKDLKMHKTIWKRMKEVIYQLKKKIWCAFTLFIYIKYDVKRILIS